MRIPRALDERSAWLVATLDRLRRSLDERRGRYGTWRTWYLHGAPEWGARYNKIAPQLNALASALYAPRSVRFALDAGPVAVGKFETLAEVAGDRLRALWSRSGADAAYGEQTLWSLVYGATLVKLTWRDDAPCAEAVAPGNFGVWRDDLCGLDGQQALLHVYRLDAETVRGWLVHAGMAELEAARWLRTWGEGGRASHPNEGNLAIGSMNPIIWNGNVPPGMAGGVSDWGSTAATYEAGDTPTLEVEELWARDDASGDWRIFQMIERELIVSDRANDYLPHHHPFIDLCVDPVEDFFWGYSLAAQLIPLQAWREKRMNQLDRMFARQANPPMVTSGFMGISDEKAAAIMRRGGLISSQTPSAQVKLLAPQPNEMSFQEIGEIDAMFSETLGLTEMLQGNPQPNVRGGTQAAAMLGAGAGRLTRRMMSVERAVAQGAGLLLGLARRYDPTTLIGDEGTPFTLAMLPGDLNVEVAAHSASPVFAAEAQRLAFAMLENKLADPVDFYDLADPPMAQALKARYKRRQQRQRADAQKALQSVPAQERAGLLAKLLGGARK